MTFATIRAELKALLEATTGIGQVHDFRRHSTTWEQIFERSKESGIINHTEITRIAADQDISSLGNADGSEPFYHDTHTISIRNYYGVNDEKKSEKTFQDLIDAIVAKIRIDAALSNPLGGTVLIPRSLQVPTIEHQMYGGVLVHFAEMQYEAIERVGG